MRRKEIHLDALSRTVGRCVQELPTSVTLAHVAHGTTKIATAGDKGANFLRTVLAAEESVLPGTSTHGHAAQIICWVQPESSPWGI